MYSNWTVSEDGYILCLTLNRPEALNALTVEALHELRTIAQSISQREHCRVVVLQAKGSHFSAGVDVRTIAAMRGQTAQQIDEALADLQSCLDAFEAIPQPTIARLRGHVIGGGLILAACCDFRIADTTAQFSLPEVRLGIPVVMGTQRITRLIGSAAATEMILLAKTIDAHTALRWNLVHRVVESNALDAAISEMSQQLLSFPPLTIMSAKRLIRLDQMSLHESQRIERQELAALVSTPDFAEATEAFFSKRTPHYTGQATHDEHTSER